MQHLTFAQPKSPGEFRQALWAEAEAIHEEDRQMCAQIGEHGASLIKSGDTILTHCNTGALATGGIGTALGVIYTCRDQGKDIKVYADETRPLLQGARLTAWELLQEGIDVTLNCDNMAGMLMAQGEIDHVIVGADRIAANGDTANKIGTYSLAILAVAHNVPFYVAAPSTTFDDKIESGDDIPIEERSPDEVTAVLGHPIAPPGVKAYSPAFDVTPNELISWFITEAGLHPGGRRQGSE
jgi:methylthioribose-1-phosphate isomerase